MRWLTGVAVLALLALATGSSSGTQRITLYGSKSPALGNYLSGGVETTVDELIETLGLTWSEATGIEPLTTLSYWHPIGDQWMLNAALGFGGLGGGLGNDYRVNRLPEVHAIRNLAIPGSPFSFSLDIGAGSFTVRPGNLSSVRENITARLYANIIRLSPDISLNGNVSYAYQIYGSSNPNGAATGTMNLSVTYSPSVSTILTYFRQMATGSSPLLFDNLPEDSYTIGVANLALSPDVTLQYSQKYSFIFASVVDRTYAVVVSNPALNLSIGYDNVPQAWLLTLYYTL